MIKLDKERKNFLVGVMGSIMFFAQLYSSLLDIMTEYMGRNPVSPVFMLVSFLIVPLLLGYYFAHTAMNYFASTDRKKFQSLFNQFYFGWMPLLSAVFGILFFFHEDFDLLLIYFAFSTFFFIIGENGKEESNLNQIRNPFFIRRKFILLQFAILSWFVFLLIHFWMKQRLLFLGLMVPLGLWVIFFWVRPEKIISDYVQVLRFFLYGFGLSIILIGWIDFDLIRIFNFSDFHSMLTKLFIDVYIILYFQEILRRKYLQKVID